MDPSDQQWAYLAGFFDGEACFTSRRRRPSNRLQPRITVSQKAFWVLEELKVIFQVGRFQRRANAAGKNGYWEITQRGEVEWILRGVMPYLTLKKAQAELLLQLCPHPRAKEEEWIRSELSHLKHV